MTEPLPVSVVVPTVGRLEQLSACLESIIACSPPAAEVLVIDQGGGHDTRDLTERYAGAGARHVRCDGRGVGPATNRGIRAASHSVVLVTHDDCRVDPDWVRKANVAAEHDPDAIVTGRVKPLGDPRRVPSFKDDPRPYDYTGTTDPGALYPNNMVLPQAAFLAFGGFDERFGPSEPAEDLDLCYRWLRAGLRLRYEPELVVWHAEWRTERELEQLYVSYWRGTATFYAKHLRSGDFTMLARITSRTWAAFRAAAARAILQRPRWADSGSGYVRGFPPGLIAGWRIGTRNLSR